MSNNTADGDFVWDNIGDFSLYGFANVIATSVTTSCLLFGFQYILPKLKNSISSYNLYRAGKKIKEVVTCCKRSVNPIEEFLPTELDHDIYKGVLDLSDYLHLMAKSNDNASESRNRKGKFIYDFPTTKVLIRNLNGEQLPDRVSQDLLKDANKDTEKFLKMQEAILQQVRNEDQLSNYLSAQLSKWFLKGKCKFTISKDSDGLLAKNYYLGDHNFFKKGFVPLVVITIIEKTNDIILNQADYDRGMSSLNLTSIDKGYHTNKIELEERSNSLNV
jgi:hypothetical protein